jgi:hypothetical protein
MANEKRWCFAWFAQAPAGAGAERAALQKDAKWLPGETITVSFLDGDRTLWKKVQDAALLWTKPGLANLNLEFLDDTHTDIRISFRYDGSWSTVGNSCRQVPYPEPTMNYGWLTPASSQEEIEEVVLHEFGHALGLVHEHQHPAGGIKWNRSKVIQDLSGPPNNWSVDEIEFNVLEPSSKKETNFTSQMDPDSIMMYTFPSSWTLDGYSTHSNSKLSRMDKEFIHEQYS